MASQGSTKAAGERAMQTYHWMSAAQKPPKLLATLAGMGYRARPTGEWESIATDAPEAVVADLCRRAGKPRWMSRAALDDGLTGGVERGDEGVIYAGWEEWPEG